MNKQEYFRLIKDVCNHVGIDAWEDIANTQHIEIDGVTVGLMFDEEQAPDILGIYYDLGVLHDPDIPRRLLEFNAYFEPENNGGGYFAYLPSKGSIVYRLNIHLGRGMTGIVLAERLYEYLHVAEQGLQDVLATC